MILPPPPLSIMVLFKPDARLARDSLYPLKDPRFHNIQDPFTSFTLSSPFSYNPFRTTRLTSTEPPRTMGGWARFPFP